MLLKGSGCKSSVLVVWRTSNCSPGAVADMFAGDSADVVAVGPAFAGHDRCAIWGAGAFCLGIAGRALFVVDFKYELKCSATPVCDRDQ